MAGKRKVYTPEFKLAAVKMITDQKLSVAEVARRLGVTENRLHDWKKAVVRKGADAFPGSGHLTPVEDELRRLRADVKRLEMERDIQPSEGVMCRWTFARRVGARWLHEAGHGPFAWGRAVSSDPADACD